MVKAGVRIVSLAPEREFDASAVSILIKEAPATELYTLSLHDALPILDGGRPEAPPGVDAAGPGGVYARDRKSTRLNSSHRTRSYAVFCLKKKKELVGHFGLFLQGIKSGRVEPGSALIVASFDRISRHW